MQSNSDLESKPEKGVEASQMYAPPSPDATLESGSVDDAVLPSNNRFQRLMLRLEAKLGMEARGIERVPESLRATKTTFGNYVQMCLIWFSANLTANNFMIGLLGPTVFSLGLTDAMLIGTFGAIIGGMGSAYISTFGPVSGCRTLVSARFTMGWWPSRLCVLLNIVIMLGYGLIDMLIAGQILSTVNGAGMSVIVGVVVSALISLVVCLFGIRVFHVYERYSFVPQLIVLLILIGVAGPHFDPSSISTASSSAALSAEKMSFFFLCVSACLAWAPASADFYVYFPPDAKRWTVFLSTTIGLGGSCMITYLLGVGVASGVATNPAWGEAYNNSVGALIVEAYRPLGAFGHCCAVIIALGLISNNVPGTYSAALSFQLLGRWFMAVPRTIWTVVGVIIYTVCACAGRNQLFAVFEGFLALMGYWTAIWIVITLEEEFIFRRRAGPGGPAKGYDWRVWNDPRQLPVGLAALAAFCVGWLGAVLGMWQNYFTGPLGKLVGEGIDLGMPVGASWAGLVFPGLRWVELRVLGR